VWFALKSTVGIRIDAEHELGGMDLADCGIEAYPEFTKTV